MVSVECQIGDFVIHDTLSEVFCVVKEPFTFSLEDTLRIKVKAVGRNDSEIYSVFAFSCRYAKKEEIAAAIAQKLNPPPLKDLDRIGLNLSLKRAVGETDETFRMRILSASTGIVDKNIITATQKT